MKKKGWIDVVAVCFLMILTCAIRVVYVNFFLNEIGVSGDLMQKALQAGKNPLSLLKPDFDSIYAVLLSYAVSVFGNKAIVGVGLNVGLQIVNVLLIYICVRIVSDVIIAMIPTFIISALPIYFMTVRTISSFQVFNIGITLSILLLVLICKVIVALCRNIFTKREIIDDDMEYEGDHYESSKGTSETEQFSQTENIDKDLEDYVTEDDAIDGNESEEPTPYQDEVWANTVSNAITPFSENEIKVLTGEDNTSTNINKGENPYMREQNNSLVEANKLPNPNRTMNQNAMDNATKSDGLNKPVRQKRPINQNKPMNAKGTLTLNYDFNPRNDYMHYDIEDMTGMDYFDIE